MPYIPKETRKKFGDALSQCNPRIVGELTYCIYFLCLRYLEGQDCAASRYRYSYTIMAEVISALQCSLQEFYRRVVAPYEDKKRKQNGDV